MPDRKGKVLMLASISLAIFSCASTALISLPMPTQGLWLLAAGANEFTLWLLIIALVGCVTGLIAGYRQKSIVCFVAAAASSITLGFMTLLTLQIFATAQKYQAQLSFLENLTSSPTRKVTKTADVTYETVDGKQLKLDVYCNADLARGDPGRSEKNSDGVDNGLSNRTIKPAVIIMHGGSWRRGHKSDLERFDNWLADKNFVVFEIDYRLATGECHFPKQLDDVEAAISWVEKHAPEYNADPGHIFLLGRSAGAQLALIAAYENPTKIKGVASYYSPTDLVWDYRHPCVFDIVKTRPTIENYLGGAPDTVPALYERASAIKQVTSKSPPTLILQGGRDQVVGEENAKFLAEKLDAVGVPFLYVYLPWANHGFDYRLSGWSSQISNSTLLRFLEQTLASQK
jgi:acetyl esterase/lipase